MTEIGPSATSLELERLPYLIQGCDAPAFRGEVETGEYLRCANCGHILIEHYAEDDYVRVGIKCFKCGEITWTPSLPLGEVFSAATVTLGAQGVGLIGSTVIARSGVIITCDQEIRREIEATAPRNRQNGLQVSEEGLVRLVAQYDKIVGNKFATQRKIVERVGVSSIRTFPFVWAIVHLEKCLRAGVIDITHGDTSTALLWLQMFGHVVARWEHHSRFQVVAKDIGKPKSFLHTTNQLITAAYLYQTGNRIGLSLEDREGEPNPDLYIRGVRGAKFFLEVKAPEALQWGGRGCMSSDGIERAVISCVKRSKDQINRTHRGVLIIASSFLADRFPALLKVSIQNALKSKGRDHRGLAAVVGQSPKTIQVTGHGDRNFQCLCEHEFTVTLNERYDGHNPIATQHRRP